MGSPPFSQKISIDFSIAKSKGGNKRTEKKNPRRQCGGIGCRQSNFEAAEGFGKQIRFPNGIRSRNSLPARKTASFKAFKLMELVCLFLCLSKSKS
ncbi:MAG TPA: hypothetical protein DC021_08745 [Tyzzerella sp.]|nr:hypothetical protein [Tyzzerella sp.]